MIRDGILPPEFDEFSKFIFGADDLGAVVRVHIQLEQLLNAFIDRALIDSSKIKKSNFEFSQLVDLALALGLPSNLGAPLNAMGTLRNRFAHRPGIKLDQSAVNNLYATLSASDKELVQTLFIEVHKSRPELKPFTKFKDVPARNQFSLIAVLLWSSLHLLNPMQGE